MEVHPRRHSALRGTALSGEMCRAPVTAGRQASFSVTDEL